MMDDDDEEENAKPKARSANREARLEDLEHTIAGLEGLVAKLARGEPIEELPKFQQERDKIWICAACSYRLGTYDSLDMVLRIRHRDLFVYVSLGGPGGFVEVICRKCGEKNRTVYVPD
jgi:hypothetical protein